MGQLLDSGTDARVPFDDDGNNGLILGDEYIPEELISEILCYVDYKSLLRSQLVCKRWKMLMESYVWRKKAELAVGCSLQAVKDLPWQSYYAICDKRPFNRNLVKNHSGQDGVDKNWIIMHQGGDHWKVENSPVGAPPLPTSEPVFQGTQCCFVTSYNRCTKMQYINLESEGLTSILLDTFQPPIVISEWYCCRWDCPATYECSVTLVGEKSKILQVFNFRRSIQDEDQNKWHQVSHEFKNYGKGLKKIMFCHTGIDNLFWLGHYGSKMAGASVIVKIPDSHHHSDDEKNTSTTSTADELASSESATT